MIRTAITSSVIENVGYDPDTNVLEINFHAGRTYHYFMVPPAVHAALLSAASAGNYFNVEIRNRYPYKEVGEG
jgi:hypothetical protein